MKLHLEATPDELDEKGPELISRLAKSFTDIAPDLAEALSKAAKSRLPAKEQVLKYPVLRALQEKTEAEYAKMLGRMARDISRVLDGKLDKSEGIDLYKADAPKKMPKGQAAYVEVENSLYACNECEHWVPDMDEPTCVLHKPGQGAFASYGRCASWAKGEPVPERKPQGDLTKEASFYRENEYHSGFKCNRCKFYVQGGACSKVAGKISDEGSCKLWEVIRGEPVPLQKGESRGGKYYRRTPYIDSKGKRRWRYYYRESSAAREAKAGEEIRLGKVIARIVDVGEDGSITLELNGKERSITPATWSNLLTRHYGTSYTVSAEKRAKQAINAVLKHVPREMLEDLKGETDAERLKELKTKVPEVYKRLQSSFTLAGVSPYEAKRTLARTLERRGWEPEARAMVIGTVMQHREIGTSELIDASENLAGGSKVQARHVAAVVELRAPDSKPEAFPDAVKATSQAAEKELADLSSMLAQGQAGDIENAEVLAAALASEAIQKLNMLTQAFPGLADKVAQQAREIIPQVASLAPRERSTAGSETVVYVAGEGGKPKALKARYKLVEANLAVASHNPDSFAKRDDYPADVQERAYHRDKAEQAKVIRNAQQLNPRFVVNTNPDAVNGPPMVTADGVVLGGNSRVMSMQRAYTQHPEQGAALKSYLAEHAHEVGLQSADVEAMDNPILVRVVEPEDTSKQNLQLMVRQMNESFTQGMDPRTMQVAMGRKLSEQDLQTLASEMEEDETLSAFLASSRSERFVNALFRAGVIDNRNSNQYMKKGTRTLNNDGRTLVNRILVGRIVQDADVLSDTGTQMMESIARSVPAMVQAKASGESYDLGPDLKVAIDAFNDLQRRSEAGHIAALDPKMKDSTFARLFNNFDVLPGIGEPHPILKNERATKLLEVLVRKRGPTQMAKVFREYAKRAAQNPEGQSTMFGAAASPTEILDGVISEAMGRKEKLAASLESGDLEKAKPHKYIKRWKNARGEWEYLYADDKQMQLPLKDRSDEPEVKKPSVMAQLVDGEKIDTAWASMSLALQNLHDEMVTWHNGFYEKGATRKKMLEQLEEIHDRFQASIPKPRAIKVAGLLVESLDSAIEQHAATMGSVAFEARRNALTRKDSRTGRFDYTFKELKEDSWMWSGLLKEREYGIDFFRAGKGMKLYPTQTKQEASEAKEKLDEWADHWRKQVGIQLKDVAGIPENHQKLLEAAGTRVRFLTHTSVSETGGSFTAGEAMFDDRTKDHLIQMYGWSSIPKDDSEVGVTLTHEVGHIIDRLILTTLENPDDKLASGDMSKDPDIRLQDVLTKVIGADKVAQVKARDIEDREYLSEYNIQWMQWTQEWLAEAYRYAYRDGGEMKTTLKQGDFDHAKFRAEVDALVERAVATGKVFKPKEHKPTSFEMIDTPKRKQKPVTFKSLHHGTDAAPFDKFDAGKFGSTTDAGLLGEGVYLSTDPQISRSQKTHIESKVTLKNPVRVTMNAWGDDKSQLVSDALGLSEKLSGKALSDAAKAKGHDGVVLDYSPLDYKHQEVAVFDPEQVAITGSRKGGKLAKGLKVATFGEADFHDHTEAINEKESRGYKRVQEILAKFGYSEADYKEGGPLYGKSTNELMALVKEKRKG